MVSSTEGQREDVKRNTIALQPYLQRSESGHLSIESLYRHLAPKVISKCANPFATNFCTSPPCYGQQGLPSGARTHSGIHFWHLGGHLHV